MISIKTYRSLIILSPLNHEKGGMVKIGGMTFVNAGVFHVEAMMASREINFPEIFENPFRNDFYCSGTDDIVQECSITLRECLLVKLKKSIEFFKKHYLIDFQLINTKQSLDCGWNKDLVCLWSNEGAMR